MTAPSISPAIRQSLTELAARDRQQGIQSLFAQDDNRAARFSYKQSDLYFDFSKTHISDELIALYSDFARDASFVDRRHELFSGARINVTEDRAVLHTLLRDPDNQGIAPQEPQLLDQAALSRSEFVKQYYQIEQQLAKREVPITDIIHVGIGGSSLGTQLVFESLTGLATAIRVHFIGNIDAHQLVAVLDQCDVHGTLVIGVSKTFTTAETLQNLRSIGEWYGRHGYDDYLASYIAVTANPDNAQQFGIDIRNIVSFPQWVGGRYSVWSSVSLSAALVLGIDKFDEFLAGGATIDRHFYQASAEQNICFLAAALDHYYVNFLGAGSRAIFAYDFRLRSLVDYLQQLETESNGKDRQRDGRPVDQLTSAVIWGGVGTDVQHSVFQMLHQGTSLIPSEFILVKQPDHDLIEHHRELLANGVAQPAALLAGQDLQTVRELHADEGLTELAMRAKVFSGNRPSTTMVVDELTPASLGALLAFYEHRTFCGGVLANINSYDQMGVELGKRLAKQVKPILDTSSADQAKRLVEQLDASTQQLILQLKD